MSIGGIWSKVAICLLLSEGRQSHSPAATSARENGHTSHQSLMDVCDKSYITSKSCQDRCLPHSGVLAISGNCACSRKFRLLPPSLISDDDTCPVRTKNVERLNTHQLAIQALTKGITAAAPKCGKAAPIPAYLQVTHPSTHPSTANNVAIVAAAFRSLLATKIAEMMPNVRLRPPMHCTKPEAKVSSWMGMPNRAAIVVGERRARSPVLRRKAVTL